MHIRGSSIYLAVTFLTSTTAVLAAVQPYGQCGGNNHQGETTCTDGWTCTKYNDWYSQCVGGQNNGGGNAPTSTAAEEEPTAVPEPSGNGTETIVVSTTLETIAPTAVPEPEPEPSNNATAPVNVPSTLQTIIATLTPTVEPEPEPETEATSTAVVVASSVVPSPSAAPSAGSGANGVACSLDAAFKAHGKKYFGVATDRGRLAAGENAQIIKDNFGQVTPENRYVPSLSSLQNVALRPLLHFIPPFSKGYVLTTLIA
jgi:endo-1,4-beta-xylanase